MHETLALLVSKMEATRRNQLPFQKLSALADLWEKDRGAVSSQRRNPSSRTCWSVPSWSSTRHPGRFSLQGYVMYLILATASPDVLCLAQGRRVGSRGGRQCLLVVLA